MIGLQDSVGCSASFLGVLFFAIFLPCFCGGLPLDKLINCPADNLGDGCAGPLGNRFECFDLTRLEVEINSFHARMYTSAHIAMSMTDVKF